MGGEVSQRMERWSVVRDSREDGGGQAELQRSVMRPGKELAFGSNSRRFQAGELYDHVWLQALFSMHRSDQKGQLLGAGEAQLGAGMELGLVHKIKGKRRYQL